MTERRRELARIARRSPPARIEIPAIGVSAPVIRLGLNPDRTLEVLTTAHDVIRVRRRDGRVVRYRVSGARSVSKDDFPTDAVYGHRSRSTLRDNLVAFATLA